MRNIIKDNKGITLVALVITVVILIILAAISLTVLFGNNGLIEKSKEGAESYKTAEQDELSLLSAAEEKISSLTGNGTGSGNASEQDTVAVFRKITETNDVTTFNYKNEGQEFIASETGYYKIECWGAQGGTISGVAGGKGAYTKGIIKLKQNDKLYIYTGESYDGYKDDWSFNGGGRGSYGTVSESIRPLNSNGGGATDIRLYGGQDVAWDNFDSLKSRIMVAAGGGGCWKEPNYNAQGGAAGTIAGKGGNITNWQADYSLTKSTSGTQTTGGIGANDIQSLNGKFGKGGYSEQYTNSWIYYSGGGGGYYGGGAGRAGSGAVSSAAGGSSYISGYEGCNSIAESSTEENIVHTGEIVHYSGKYFLYAQMCSGDDYFPSKTNNSEYTNGNTGSGYVKITKVNVE